MRILVVEDDPVTGAAVRRGLEEEGYRVDWAREGEEALLFAADRSYGCIVLDRMLPGLSGDQVLRRLRGAGCSTPVLVLTALDGVADRVSGLDAGADDYLVKPFAFAELLARIRALVRRSAGGLGTGSSLAAGDLALDRERRLARCGSRSVVLTGREAALLELLLLRSGKLVPVEAIEDHLWNEPWDASPYALWAHVKNLRKKLEAIGSRSRIVTRRGAGYMLCPSQDRV